MDYENQKTNSEDEGSTATPDVSSNYQLFDSEDQANTYEGRSYEEKSWSRSRSKSDSRRRHTRDSRDGHSIPDMSSVTMRMTQSDQSLPEDVQQIYEELQAISDKLRSEYKILHEREIILRERERVVSMSHANVKIIAQEEVHRKWAILEEEHKSEMQKMEQILKEKTRENKRLKDGFETLKTANDSLRKELEQLQERHEKLEKHSSSLQARFANFQRKHEFAVRQSEDLPVDLKIQAMGPGKELKEKQTIVSKPKTSSHDLHEVVAVLLDWVSEAHLRHIFTRQALKSSENLPPVEYTQEKCLKVLPPLVEFLKDLPPSNTKMSLTCLQFIYWSLLQLDMLQSSQKGSLSSTLRRLGEELYRPKNIHVRPIDGAERPSSPGKGDRQREAMFFKNNNIHVRFLSSLLILKTLTQVDHLAHVFDVLRNDLKSDSAKELFIYYQATPVVLAHFKPTNKALLSCTVDVYLQMSMEATTLGTFLDSVSTESWFRSCSMVMRTPNLDGKVIEKLSIILQKLSKIKSNKKYFEVFTITGMIQELLRTCGNDNAFLALNLKSVLFNLNTGKTT